METRFFYQLINASCALQPTGATGSHLAVADSTTTVAAPLATRLLMTSGRLSMAPMTKQKARGTFFPPNVYTHFFIAIYLIEKKLI
jgi:hypothetical protein